MGFVICLLLGAPSFLGELPQEQETDEQAGEDLPDDWRALGVKRKVTPRYPKEARLNKLEGDCQLRLYINERGRVVDVVVQECPDIFHESSIEAAEKWVFRPMRIEGERVKTTFVLNLSYRLD